MTRSTFRTDTGRMHTPFSIAACRTTSRASGIRARSALVACVVMEPPFQVGDDVLGVGDELGRPVRMRWCAYGMWGW